MKNKRTLALATLITLTTTTMHSMELQKLESETIENLTKQRRQLRIHLICSKKIIHTRGPDQPFHYYNALFYAYHEHTTLNLKLSNGYLVNGFHYYKNSPVSHYSDIIGYSSIAAVIVNQKATLAEKQELIKKLLKFNVSAESAHPFADLEFYERKSELKNKLYHLIGAAYKDQTNVFALLPKELIIIIGQLITETEKPLL